MYREVLQFWFEEISQTQWWKKDAQFDELIASRFSEVHGQASRGELYRWRDTAEGRLAEIIVLDQFSRNIYRNSPLSFATDSLALVLSQEAISSGADKEVVSDMRSFFYMPFMHSESAVIHSEAVSLYEACGNEANLKFELRHKAIIDRFGRYPHRNEILGRDSTAEEIEFLSHPGSSF
ncbi:MAG: DUF924 domain-containing protein [Porticoccaceae bacterium]|nr:DUF924 domain-containing protein [Porticoccaceae bacterium]